MFIIGYETKGGFIKENNTKWEKQAFFLHFYRGDISSDHPPGQFLLFSFDGNLPLDRFSWAVIGG